MHLNRSSQNRVGGRTVHERSAASGRPLITLRFKHRQVCGPEPGTESPQQYDWTRSAPFPRDPQSSARASTPDDTLALTSPAVVLPTAEATILFHQTCTAHAHRARTSVRSRTLLCPEND